jgi:hypothetical protein
MTDRKIELIGLTDLDLVETGYAQGVNAEQNAFGFVYPAAEELLLDVELVEAQRFDNVSPFPAAFFACDYEETLETPAASPDATPLFVTAGQTQGDLTELPSSLEDGSLPANQSPRLDVTPPLAIRPPATFTIKIIS